MSLIIKSKTFKASRLQASHFKFVMFMLVSFMLEAFLIVWNLTFDFIRNWMVNLDVHWVVNDLQN